MNATTWDKTDWLNGFMPSQQDFITGLADNIISDLNRIDIEPDEQKAYQLAVRYLEPRDYDWDNSFLTWSRDFIEGRHGF